MRPSTFTTLFPPLHTVNDESLEGLKFGESAKKSIWRKKVWRISPRILVVYNISYMLANKVWRNITIRQIHQTLVPPNFRRLRYICANDTHYLAPLQDLIPTLVGIIISNTSCSQNRD